jgi:hypothetical protein
MAQQYAICLVEKIRKEAVSGERVSAALGKVVMKSKNVNTNSL